MPLATMIVIFIDSAPHRAASPRNNSFMLGELRPPIPVNQKMTQNCRSERTITELTPHSSCYFHSSMPHVIWSIFLVLSDCISLCWPTQKRNRNYWRSWCHPQPADEFVSTLSHTVAYRLQRWPLSFGRLSRGWLSSVDNMYIGSHLCRWALRMLLTFTCTNYLLFSLITLLQSYIVVVTELFSIAQWSYMRCQRHFDLIFTPLWLRLTNIDALGVKKINCIYYAIDKSHWW